MAKIGRRTKDDEQWQNVKAIIKKRDKGMCILCRCLTPGEYQTFIKSRPIYTNIIDPAHYIDVGYDPQYCYDPNNIFSICRPMHDRLDSMKNPITGKSMTSSEHDEWWARIIQESGVTPPSKV